jgi:hypothetical protein
MGVLLLKKDQCKKFNIKKSNWYQIGVDEDNVDKNSVLFIENDSCSGVQVKMPNSTASICVKRYLSALGLPCNQDYKISNLPMNMPKEFSKGFMLTVE